MNIRYAALSKIGRRSNHEDAFRVYSAPEVSGWMGIVCDGLGGHPKGEVASEIVAGVIVGYWETHRDEPDSPDKVLQACTEASKAIDGMTMPLRVAEMGTTMVLASLRADMLTVAHAGDSRCYVARPGEGILYQTVDHTAMSFGREVVTRCFISYRPAKASPETRQFVVMPGDRILICSDGLYKSMPAEVLLERMMDDKAPEEVLEAFDDLCEKSGDDNYTAILAYVDA